MDTIFALATATGRAAVAVMRLSGPATRTIVAGIAGRVPPARRASLRRLRDADGGPLDDALVLWFPGPRSYTGEDGAEFHLHGGTAIIEAVAAALVAHGARPAEAGEFTRRAVMNGRMDLTAAEGVLDLIEAETAAQARHALLNAGALAARAEGWAFRLTDLLARAEAAIEFGEDGVGEAMEDGPGALALAEEIASSLVLDTGGERVRAGLDVAILGAPNAGKSSLLNALIGRDAAIVSARAGTTRDVVEARTVLAGLPATIADTAGLREAGDAIEAEGVRRAVHRGEAADLVIAVFATDEEPDGATLSLLDTRPCIAVVNKSDLTPGPPLPGALRVSARTGAGLPALRARLEDEARALLPRAGAGLLTRPRHRAALRDACTWLREAASAPLPELRADALRAASRSLGRLTGRVGAEDVLDRVFAAFCVGK